MRKIIIGIALVTAMAASAVIAPKAAQAQDYPNVANLTPFTAEANYMSKPGYLRYRNYVSTNTWISYEEAARVVAEQGG